MVLEVANTGVWKEEEFRSRKGLGLENIRQRLRLLYGRKAAFGIESKDGWVRAIIKLPVGESGGNTSPHQDAAGLQRNSV